MLFSLILRSVQFEYDPKANYFRNSFLQRSHYLHYFLPPSSTSAPSFPLPSSHHRATLPLRKDECPWLTVITPHFVFSTLSLWFIPNRQTSWQVNMDDLSLSWFPDSFCSHSFHQTFLLYFIECFDQISLRVRGFVPVLNTSVMLVKIPQYEQLLLKEAYTKRWLWWKEAVGCCRLQ